jgi:hypothetical protein
MKNLINKIFMAVMIAALVFTAIPMTSAYAQGENPPEGTLTNEKLEQIWAREIKAYERLGRGFSDINATIAKFQGRLDQAAGNGRDVASLQAALAAFETALNRTKPTYDRIGVLVSSHQGFDANGKVTDAAIAKTTLKEVGAKLKEVKSSMDGTGKALYEAMKAFRKANKPIPAPPAGDS